MNDALGIIEVVGMTALVEATDAMTKSAHVELTGYRRIGAGLVTVFVRGDVAACMAAVEAGKAAASRVGKVVSAHVIPRPHGDLEAVFPLR